MLVDLVSSPRTVDVALACIGLEALLLFLLRRRTGLGLLDVVGQLAAGAALLLALRCTLTGANPAWIGVFLAAAFPVHLFDVVRRWRKASGRPEVTPSSRPSSGSSPRG